MVKLNSMEDSHNEGSFSSLAPPFPLPMNAGYHKAVVIAITSNNKWPATDKQAGAGMGSMK